MILRMGWMPITPEIIELAGERTFTTAATLDALHLATAVVARDAGMPGLVFATHDRQLAGAATSIGFEVAGV